MAVFPAITFFDANIADVINNTPKHTFSGSKPFISLTKFYNNQKTINYTSYTAFDLSKMNSTERFPPIITGLEVGTSGTLGAIKKAKINVRFASMNQFKENSEFFIPGATQCLIWGWSNGTMPADFPDPLDTAKAIVNNTLNYQAQVSKYKQKIDILAGVLVNFSVNINADATVDTVIELGSPADIPGYLSLKQQNKDSSVDADSNDNNLTNVAKALDLDGTLSTTSKDEIKKHSINYSDWSVTNLIDSFDSVGETDQEYIQLGFAINQLCNQAYKIDSKNANSLEFAIDLENSVAMGHPNMISVSEHVVFPNSTTMAFDTTGTTVEGVRILKPITSETQKLGPFNGTHEFPAAGVTTQVPYGGKMVSYKTKDKYAGYIKNIYISTQFLIDTSKGVETINDFLQKIVDELNVAGAGLYNLIVRADASSTKGKDILSIVDLNFMDTKPAVSSTPIKLFTENSRIIDLNVTADLPKEMLGEIMLGSTNSDTKQLGTPGTKMFGYDLSKDPLAKAAYGKTGDGLGSSGAPPPPPPEPAWYTLFGNKVATFFKNQFNVGGPNIIKFSKKTNFGDGGAKEMWAIYKDVSVVKNLYAKDKDGKGNAEIHRNALVPVTVSMTVLGVAGVSIGSACKIEPTPAPWLDDGFWQVTNVEHKVDDTKWETIIEFKYRISK
jgi:hypothetical protein